MPWTDAPSIHPAETNVARLVAARTQLTIVLTDLELTHRILARMHPGIPLDVEVHASLVALNDDALHSGRVLAEGLHEARRAERQVPVAAGE